MSDPRIPRAANAGLPPIPSPVDTSDVRVHIRLTGDDGQPLPGHICLPVDDAQMIAKALEALTDPLVISACTPQCEASRRRLAADSRHTAGGAL